MKISSAFPSSYLKAADIEDNDITLTMGKVTMEQVGNSNDTKPVLYFQDHTLGLMLNKTNANNIAALYGDDTGDWFGNQITLFKAWVDFQGKTVEAIRVRQPSRQRRNGAQTQAASAPARAQQNQASFNDDPFPGDLPSSPDNYRHPNAPGRA